MRIYHKPSDAERKESERICAEETEDFAPHMISTFPEFEMLRGGLMFKVTKMNYPRVGREVVGEEAAMLRYEHWEELKAWMRDGAEWWYSVEDNPGFGHGELLLIRDKDIIARTDFLWIY